LIARYGYNYNQRLNYDRR